MTEGARAQDQGRRHRRRGTPTGATSTLLTRYQSVMRIELTGLLDELEATEPAGLGLAGEVPKITGTAERAKRWELAIRLARELGTEVDVRPVEDVAAGAPIRMRPQSRRRADFGGA